MQEAQGHGKKDMAKKINAMAKKINANAMA